MGGGGGSRTADRQIDMRTVRHIAGLEAGAKECPCVFTSFTGQMHRNVRPPFNRVSQVSSSHNSANTGSSATQYLLATEWIR